MTHDWRYKGVVYRVGSQLSGSSAKAVCYFDCFYCSRCLATTTKAISGGHNTYEGIKFRAAPAPDDTPPGECKP